MKILLVEDNISIIKGLVFSLTNAGYEVVTAENIEIAHQKLNQDNIDLAILDISLPDGDGMSLYETYNELPRGRALKRSLSVFLSTRSGYLFCMP